MMHRRVLLAAVACALASPLVAQQSDTTARHDSTGHATSRAATAASTLSFGAIADLLVDATPDGSTLESERRFELREIQMGVGAGIDRYLRGDIVLSLDDAQQLSVMEASLTTVGLPYGLQAKAGRFHLPFGQQNTTHRAELYTVDYPLVIRRFLGSQGGMGTGVGLRTAFELFGGRQEVQLTAIEQFPDDHGHEAGATHHEGIEGRPASPASKTLQGLGYTARIRNSWTISEAGQIELSLSGGTGKRAQPFGCDLHEGHPVACPGDRGETGVNARQSLVGADVTIRFRSNRADAQEWLLLQSEVMRLHNEEPSLPPGAPDSARYLGPTAEATGAYFFARWRAAPRFFVGGRLDWIDAADALRDVGSVSGYLQLALSELARVTVAFERARPETGKDQNRLLLQAVVALGAHRMH